jgi:pyridoxine 4-dehydrogenase
MATSVVTGLYAPAGQNPMNLADQRFLPVLDECAARGIAFVPFFPLGSAFASGNSVPGR